uniref:Uncharacterized protein n=1 Tax=Megaselia scalaris TaxID=36166 RepID=T1GNC6_MEGSC
MMRNIFLSKVANNEVCTLQYVNLWSEKDPSSNALHAEALLVNSLSEVGPPEPTSSWSIEKYPDNNLKSCRQFYCLERNSLSQHLLEYKT